MATITLSTQDVVRAIQTGRPLPPKTTWSTLQPDTLRSLLNDVCAEIAPTKDPLKKLERFVNVLSLDQIEAAVRGKYSEHVSALEVAKSMLESAKYHLEATQERASPTLRAKCSAFLASLISILESILSAFGIADLFKSAENELQAEFKGQKVLMLVTLFSMLSGILLPLLGPLVGSLVIGGILLVISLLSLIFPHIRPAPSSLPRAENWTLQIQQEKLDVVEGRKQILDAIAETLIGSKNVKTHPMLIGPSGVGKTETAKAFAKAVERGDYPELAGKKVFYLNTADLLMPSEMFSSGNKILSRINDAIGRHREDFILVFDEIHMACQKREQTALSDQLKTLLDPGNDKFPYVIGLTTEEEYFRDIYANNKAFARRFKRISISSTSDDETLEILSRTLLRDAPHVLLEQGALEALIQKTQTAFSKNAPQPATALKILSKCIQKTTATQRSPLEDRIEQVRKKIQAKSALGALGQATLLLPYGRQTEGEDIHALEKQISQLEEQLRSEKQRLLQFFEARKQLSSLKTATFQTVLKVSNVATLSRSTQHTLSRFVLLSHFLSPALESWVRKEAAQLNIQTVIGPELIDRAIHEEIESERLAREMIEKPQMPA